MQSYPDHPHQPDFSPTPDRRYFVVRGRLWRLSNPFLDDSTHAQLVRDLMNARRAVRDAKDPMQRIEARARVDDAKRALGERGDPWWSDGAPDFNRQLAVDTPYADWYVDPSAPQQHSRSEDPAGSAFRRPGP